MAIWLPGSSPITNMYLDHLYNFTILTTTACNAACSYCYEKGIKHRQSMSVEMAEKIAKFLIENFDYTKQALSITWFGGEPLYNYKVIDIISNRINAAGIKLKSSMITNGYLLNKRNIEQCLNEWHMTNMQITLDGVNEKYNNVKKYIYKDDPNPFNTVINNIKELIKNGISINIRMNINNDNAEDIKELVNYLIKEFKFNPHRKYLTFYTNKMYFTDNSLEYTEKLVNNILEIDKIILDNGFFAKSIQSGVRANHCQVDVGDGVTIFPDGKLGLCQGTLEDRFIGHIEQPGFYDIDMLKSLIKYKEHGEICKDCILKPNCLMIELCTDHNQICNEHFKRYRIEKTINEMINTYKNYLENKKQNQNNNCNCNYNNVNNCNKFNPNNNQMFQQQNSSSNCQQVYSVWEDKYS